MKDHRVSTLRRALDGVLESLEATLRVRSRVDPNEIPEDLRSANRLVERLGLARRLSAFTPQSGVLDAERVQAMSDAIRRLDGAFVTFHQTLVRAPASLESAVASLRDEIDVVKGDNDSWAAP